ncbi:hypothetical protein DFA_10036 [Cavenderia fasciculata]|uniref:Uncharacterized protein n=1 Tax=Cavenderia fasciculata TaxID=261658 RepID=F4Q937_CACFS|nr:uncharacterized protein DFA_10036 [Cavenderia fasciculata]EGG15206.1 hypothetical protein DFA_10036 [Cavenderia fasciculata]|eukprot:XP_004351926.1 hypothetical protein DFA_10036 [Cavenderia fasciculata]
MNKIKEEFINLFTNEKKKSFKKELEEKLEKMKVLIPFSELEDNIDQFYKYGTEESALLIIEWNLGGLLVREKETEFSIPQLKTWACTPILQFCGIDLYGNRFSFMFDYWNAMNSCINCITTSGNHDFMKHIDGVPDLMISSLILMCNQVTLYRCARIVFILFDVTDLQSFENLKGWHCETQRYCWEMVEVVIVGTKRDLVDQRMVTREQANDFALGLGCSYFEVGQDDESCIDRVYSIIARHLYENMYKDFEDNRLDLLPLHLDSISSSSSLSTRANTSTTTTTTTIKDQLFYSVFRSKYIRNNIFKQIPIIHSDLNVQLARGIGMPNIEFWCTNRYFNVLKYYKEKRLPIEINKFAKVSPFLRMSGNLELLQYIVEKIGDLNHPEKNQVINEVMVGGDLSMVQYLFSQGYYWTLEGLLMAIAFNHIDIVEFIFEKSGEVTQDIQKDLITRPPFLNQNRLKRCIQMAKSYNREEIVINLKKYKKRGKFKKQIIEEFKEKDINIPFKELEENIDHFFEYASEDSVLMVIEWNQVGLHLRVLTKSASQLKSMANKFILANRGFDYSGTKHSFLFDKWATMRMECINRLSANTNYEWMKHIQGVQDVCRIFVITKSKFRSTVTPEVAQLYLTVFNASYKQ